MGGMTPEPGKTGGGVKLSRAQRELLADLASYPYGEGRVNPVGERTASVLRRHGLIEWAGTGGWVKVTDKGREALAPRWFEQTCPRCDGAKIDQVLSSGEEDYPCVTCNETGKVYVYVGCTSSTGGYSVVVSLVGHREPPSDDECEELASVASKAAWTLLDAARESSWWRDRAAADEERPS